MTGAIVEISLGMVCSKLLLGGNSKYCLLAHYMPCLSLCHPACDIHRVSASVTYAAIFEPVIYDGPMSGTVICGEK